MARNKFNVDEELATSFNKTYMKRILKYVVPFKKEMYLTLLIMFISSFAGLVGPYLVKNALDDYIPNQNIKGLIIVCLIYLFTIVITAYCLKFKIKVMTKVGQNVIYDIRKDIFEHLQELPFSYYDSRPHGKILVRVVNYVNGLSDLLSNGIINAITDLFTLIVIIGFMLFINVKLTLICIAGLPVLFTCGFIIKNSQRKAYQKMSSKQSNLNAYIHESICGIKVTQAFAREDFNSTIFCETSNSYRLAWMNCVKLQFCMGPFVDNISSLVVACVYIFGISKLNTAVTVGVMIAFLGYIGRFWGPISNMANFYNSLINATAYLERIFETIDEKPSVIDKPDSVNMPEIIGNLEFNNVNFAYDDGVRILHNISFTVSPGENIALVGPTGAGKTTIINLISRFYNIESGEILIDDIDISNVKIKSLRKQMGVMLQDSFIFSGTIMDNIRYGRMDASDKEVIEAAKSVRAHGFISEMKDGYYTEVNERGTRLSTGQRQLISFARAILSNPRILILDEATSSIDTTTEILLQQGLQELLKGRTSFIIAHRLSTIKNASKIMYIDNGKIIEIGTHEELIQKKGEYYNLYMSQYKLLEAI